MACFPSRYRFRYLVYRWMLSANSTPHGCTQRMKARFSNVKCFQLAKFAKLPKQYKACFFMQLMMEVAHKCCISLLPIIVTLFLAVQKINHMMTWGESQDFFTSFLSHHNYYPRSGRPARPFEVGIENALGIRRRYEPDQCGDHQPPIRRSHQMI